MNRILKAIIILGAFYFINLPGFASASISTGIQISPVTYNFEIKPGETKSQKVTITNNDTTSLDYIMEVELFSQSDESGVPSFSAVKPSEGTSTLINWVAFESGSEKGTIEPAKSKEVGFTIGVPANAEPGGHYGAIFARQIKKTATGQTDVSVAARVGTLILISVPGDVSNTAVISSFSVPRLVLRGPVDLKMRIQNTGTVHYDSKGSVNIKNIIGKAVDLEMGTHTVLPKSIRLYDATWNKKYPFGIYKITPIATDGIGNIVTGSAVLLIAIPLIIVIPIIVLIILLILGIIYLKRHLRFVKK